MDFILYTALLNILLRVEFNVNPIFWGSSHGLISLGTGNYSHIDLYLHILVLYDINQCS